MTPREKSKAQAGSLSRYLRPAAILEPVVGSKDALLRSLAEVVEENASPEVVEEILAATEERESTVNSYVGEGVAIPQARVGCIKGIALAMARHPAGFPYGLDTDQPVRLVVLVIGNETLADEHLRVLAAVANVLKDETVREKIIEEPDPRNILALLDAQEVSSPGRKSRQRSQVLISHARKMRNELGLKAILLAIEKRDDLKLLKGMTGRKSFIVVTSSARIQEEAEKLVPRTILLPHMAFGRYARIRFVSLMAFTKGFVRRGDVIAVLAGTGSGGLDGISILEIGSEFGRFVSRSGKMSDGVLPGVLERVITLATELAAEGREGKAVGTIFVVGDPDVLAGYSQQMVMNPFHGYAEDQRNILDPTLKETLKEFAVIDGAFVVRWDGVVMAAGAYLKVAQDASPSLPGGYGSRHRAACAITEVTNSIAVVLSQSSGEVTIFRKGRVMLSLSKGAS